MKYSHINTRTVLKSFALTLISGVSLACVSQAQVALPYNFDFNGLTAGTLDPIEGDINTEGGPANGWYSNTNTSDDSYRALVLSTSGFSSPFGSGNQALALVKMNEGEPTPHPSVTNYFSDTTISGTNVTGSLGGNLTGNGYKFAWDFYTSRLSSNTTFSLRDASGNQAIRVQATYNGKFRYFQNNTSTNINTDETIFSTDTWYRMEISNVDLTNDTWSVDIYQWVDGDIEPTIVLSLSDLDFNVDADELADLKIFANQNDSASDYRVYIDNVSISQQIPEASTMLWVLGLALPLLIVRLCRRR